MANDPLVQVLNAHPIGSFKPRPGDIFRCVVPSDCFPEREYTIDGLGCIVDADGTRWGPQSVRGVRSYPDYPLFQLVSRPDPEPQISADRALNILLLEARDRSNARQANPGELAIQIADTAASLKRALMSPEKSDPDHPLFTATEVLMARLCALTFAVADHRGAMLPHAYLALINQETRHEED